MIESTFTIVYTNTAHVYKCPYEHGHGKDMYNLCLHRYNLSTLAYIDMVYIYANMVYVYTW